MKPFRIIAAGECMAELSGDGARGWRLGYGGDTLNTALYLARLLGPAASVSYLTRLGGDPFGAMMLRAWAEEGIMLDLAEVVANRVTGFYAISADPAGERRFTYWRDAAPARELLSHPLDEGRRAEVAGADLLFFSGITLAIIGVAGRAQLLDIAGDLRRAGGKVAFDVNHRPRLWSSGEEARDWAIRAARSADFVFASAEDTAALFNGSGGILAKGTGELVLRDGAGPVTLRLAAGSRRVKAEPVSQPRDTTGAGDSFNAAYLAARLRGADPARAARAGAILAAEVIRHPGAIIAKAAMPDLARFMKDSRDGET